ncbi:MAG: N-acetylmuramoyl-L-alanine amidase, partial [Pseudomonadota bacterium]
KSGAYRVMLTRNSDKYLFLKERVEIARKAKAKLFISIHADSAPDSAARGLSVYTISEKASDKQSEALAAKENKADVIGGMDLSMTSKDVADILIDLTRRETMAKSNRFANLLVKNLSKLVNTLPHTHRSAGFAVLKAPEIASVLIEVGFLSNKKEESSLKNATYQAKIMQGIVASVNAYFAGKK